MVVARIKGVKMGPKCPCCVGPCAGCDGCLIRTATMTFDPPVTLAAPAGTACVDVVLSTVTLSLLSGTTYAGSVIYNGSYPCAAGEDPCQHAAYSTNCQSFGYALNFDVEDRCSGYLTTFTLYKRLNFSSAYVTDGSAVFPGVPHSQFECVGGVRQCTVTGGDLWFARGNTWDQAVGAFTIRLYCDGYVAPMMASAAPGPASAVASSAESPAPRGRCASLGTDPAPGATAARLGLSTLRQWHPCAKGRGTAGHVCLCAAAATCGACPDWTPAAD